MSQLRRVSGIEVSQDLDFQRTEWKLQRIGWVLLLAALVLASLGACGKGLLARATTQGAGDAILLRYERIARHGADTRLDIELRTPTRDTIAIWLSQSYVHGVEVLDISPEPETVVSGNDRVTFHFATDANPKISFLIQPDKLGRRTGMLGLERGLSVRFQQFVLP